MRFTVRIASAVCLEYIRNASRCLCFVKKIIAIKAPFYYTVYKRGATMKYKVYDGITKNLSDVTLNTVTDAEVLIDVLEQLAIESNIEYNYIIVPQVEIEIKF